MIITFIYPEIDKKINSGGSFRIKQNIQILQTMYDVNLIEIKSKKNFKNMIKYLSYLKSIYIKLKSSDIIFMEFPKFIFLVPFKSKLIYSAHNFETLLRWSFFKKSPSLGMLFNFILFFITEYITLYRSNIVVSITDKLTQQLSKIVKNKTITLLPKPFEKINDYIIQDNLKYITVGSFDWKPNKEAYDIFVNKIVPLLNNFSNKERIFYFVGNNNDKVEDLYIGNIKIKCLGYVESLNDIIKQIRSIIIPIYSGSGLKIKLLEAISYEVPVITTIKGAEGLEDYFDLLSPIKSYEEFANKIIEIDNYEILEDDLSNIIKLKQKIKLDSNKNWNNLFKKIEEI